MWRKKKSTKIVEKRYFISDVTIIVGNNIFEANKRHSVNEILANSIKWTKTYSKWQIKFISDYNKL